VSGPAISVVIIGRNEGARLERCLESVKRMRSPGGDVESIYVDSASADGSPQVAQASGAHTIVVRPRFPSAALGRNAGWRRATGQFVLFLDGDTILDPNFVRDSLPEFENREVAIVWGHRREIRPEASLFNRVLDLDWIYRPGDTEFCGGDALVRRSALAEVGGFDETLIAGEEPEMCRRLRAKGYRIVHVDRPMTGHDMAMHHWRQYWKRANRAGYAYAKVSERFRNSGLPFWEEDVRRNRNRAISLLVLAAAGITGSLAFGSLLPLLIAIGLLVMLALRSAYKARWKSHDLLTLLLYGLHSHLQQLPIFIGQIQWLRDRRAGRQRGLIEYKEVSG
jgi:cellulose synthase/poly-beta-1,6-N-acetylglucosamine synthase-like glycosyltransferase